MKAHPLQYESDGRIAIIGADGMLGRAWRKLLDDAGIDYDAPGRDEVDLTRAETVSAIDGRCRLVVNAAAFTDVDRCETQARLAREVNAVGAGVLARHCAKVGATLIHYSTDYVFDGNARRPYPVDAPRNPLSAYGRTKAEGEDRVQSSACDYLLIRTSWLYAPWGRNFVRTILSLAQERQTLRVVNDQIGRPTCCEHLARTSLRLIRRGARGIHHVTDGGQCTWYELARHVVNESGLSCRIEPCTTAEMPRPALRPAYSVLDTRRTEAIVGAMSPWRDQVSAVVRQLGAVAV